MDSEAVRTEVTKQTEETEGYYSILGLKGNPFTTSEGSVEEYSEPVVPYIDNGLLATLRGLAEDHISTIVRGPRGAGKTMAFNELQMSHWYSLRDDIVFAPSRNLSSIYYEIYQSVNVNQERKLALTLHRLWGRYLARLVRSSGVGHNRETVCRKCGSSFPLEAHSKPCIAYDVHVTETNDCPSVKELVEHLIDFSLILFLDMPDQLSTRELDELAQMGHQIMSYGGAIILSANLEQAGRLLRNHTFSRVPLIDMRPPGPDLYAAIYSERIKCWSQDSTRTAHPFNDEVVRTLASRARTPREFIQACGRILVEMRIQGRTIPCDQAFLDSVEGIENIGPLDETRLVTDTVMKLRDEGHTWFKIKDLVKIVLEVGLETTPQRLGRQLAEMQLPRRRNPDSEYLVSAVRGKNA